MQTEESARGERLIFTALRDRQLRLVFFKLIFTTSGSRPRVAIEPVRQPQALPSSCLKYFKKGFWGNSSFSETSYVLK